MKAVAQSSRGKGRNPDALAEVVPLKVAALRCRRRVVSGLGLIFSRCSERSGRWSRGQRQYDVQIRSKAASGPRRPNEAFSSDQLSHRLGDLDILVQRVHAITAQSGQPPEA